MPVWSAHGQLPFGSRGRPSRRSPMMLRCTWLVPPAMRPPGAASMPDAAGPSSEASAAGQVARAASPRRTSAP